MGSLTAMESGTWWPYVFEMIPRSRLKIERFDGDEGFQRPQSARFVEQQVRQFDGRRFEPLIVVALMPEDEGDEDFYYSVIDGQHRDLMAEERGIELIPCIVHRDLLTYEQRATLFNELNLRRRQLNLRDSMVARHQGKDEEMLGLLALLARMGFHLDGHKPEDANGTRALYARGALDRNYKADGAALAKALETMRTWDDTAGRRVQGVIIDALCLLARDEDFDVDRMCGVFVDFGPQALIREARELAAASQGQVTKKIVGNTLLRHYNKGLRTRRLSLDD
jgi:hypothetical protein